MPRLLLLLPATTYRAEAFLEAARKLKLEVTVGSKRADRLANQHAVDFLPLNFNDLEATTHAAVEFARSTPIHVVVGVDDHTTVVAAAISAALGLPHNPVSAVAAARNKHRLRDLLSMQGVPVPRFVLFSVDDDPLTIAEKVACPCVVKPISLSASCGVIRANNRDEFVAAFRRVAALLEKLGTETVGEGAGKILMEDFMPGREVALEGLLTDGKLQVLALFDKPDPLEGPLFEETIYVTPSWLPAEMESRVADCAQRTVRALGLTHGPLHTELRVDANGPWVLEAQPRPIGGLCARALRFGVEGDEGEIFLEELLVRHSLGLSGSNLPREACAAGVMMIPVPQSGIFERVEGAEEAAAIPGVEEIHITARLHDFIAAWPEGSSYLGFIFARAKRPEGVEAALRESHKNLRFILTPRLPVAHPATQRMPAGGD